MRDERAHAAVVGERERRTVVSFGGGLIRPIATSRDLGKTTQATRWIDPAAPSR